MTKYIDQLIERLDWMIQVVTWSDVRERTFRPVLIPDLIRTGWT